MRIWVKIKSAGYIISPADGLSTTIQVANYYFYAP